MYPMEKVIKLQDSQVSTYLAFVNSDQESIKRAIDYRHEQIRKLTSEIKDLELRYRDNELTLSELGFKTLKSFGLNSHKNGAVQPTVEDVKLNTFTFDLKVLPVLYKHNGSWWEKIEYLLHSEKRPLSGNELLKLIYAREPELNQADSAMKKKIEVNVFTTLLYKHKKEVLKRIEVGKEYKYGFANWFDGNKLKKEYMK